MTAKPVETSVMSRQQVQALYQCIKLGMMCYDDTIKFPSALRPRLFPLLIAPTGAGKSMLVAECARHLKACYLRTQRGDMAPQGARGLRPTLFRILDLLLQHERVLWHMDELDKFGTDTATATPSGNNEWGAGIYSDIWSALDGVFPIHAYLQQLKARVDEGFLQSRVRYGLYIVGSGTWQQLFSQRTRPSMGFANERKAAPRSVTAGDVAKSQLISPELLARFNADFLILNYPDEKEAMSLVERTGMARLAAETGYRITAEDLDFRRGGFRVLEALLTKLLLLRHRSRATPSSVSEFPPEP